MFLKKKFKDLDQVISENIFISTITLFFIFLFSDLSSFNVNFKINLLQYFFLSNFLVEFSFFDKNSFLKNNLFNISIFFSLIFQIYIFYIIYKNFNKKKPFFFYIIFISSFSYFFLNLLTSKNNFLPFDKLWLIFLFRNYLTSSLLIKFNRATLVIFFLSIINYYTKVDFLIYIILILIIIIIPNIKILKFKVSFKLALFIYLLASILIFIANPLTTMIINSDKNFNLHYFLSNKYFLKNHFTKINIDQKNINQNYKVKCHNAEDICNTSEKTLLLIFGDTQMHQYLGSIKNLNNLHLIYSGIKKKCLFLSKLKHTIFLRYYLGLEKPKDCSQNFYDAQRILDNSKNFKKKKIILISSWYNWYFKTQLILNDKYQIVDEVSAYETLFNELDIFLNNFQNRSDLSFVFILPLPRFNYSPNSCALNNQNCQIKYSEYRNQIDKLENTLKKIEKNYKNVRIFEPGKFFCNKNLNYCSMKGISSKKFIHYRDYENLSHNSDINFFNFLLEKN